MTKSSVVNSNAPYEDRNKLPEQRLWQAVLAQSVYDFIYGDYRSLQTQTDKYEAKKWVNLKNTDFKYTCELAGYSPEYIYRKVQNVLETKGDK
jgi:hypothetical protein